MGKKSLTMEGNLIRTCSNCHYPIQKGVFKKREYCPVRKANIQNMKDSCEYHKTNKEYWDEEFEDMDDSFIGEGF